MRNLDPVLHERLEKLISSMGYELIGYEMQPQGRQMMFRIYIDKLNGVTIDDCSLVSHQVSAMLDVEGPIQSRYILEVSSPGIDRPLFTIEHYRKNIGRRVKIRLYSAINNRRQYKGELLRVEENEIFLLVDGTEHEIKFTFSDVEKANLIGEVRF